jgi:hypothetical protein
MIIDIQLFTVRHQQKIPPKSIVKSESLLLCQMYQVKHRINFTFLIKKP